MEQRLTEWPKTTPSSQGSSTDTEKTITQLEVQVEEQRLLRLQDAKQVEAKAAKIKEWVTNKLRELEEQNQVLREQNVKCNQQLELLRCVLLIYTLLSLSELVHFIFFIFYRNHIATNRNSIQQPVRSSLSLDVRDLKHRNSRRRSESLDPPENRTLQLHHHRRNLSMEPQELARDLAAAVDGLNLIPLATKNAGEDPAHDYAEIYTPSREKAPLWLKGGPPSGGSSTTTSDSAHDLGTPRPPTPPLHRFPSWEAKIYQVASDGLAAADENETQEQENGLVNSMGITSRSQTASGGYCDISVPVYATVKGVCSARKEDLNVFALHRIYICFYLQRASQIRSMPFTGDSSDDSSDGEEHAVMMNCVTSTHNSHNSSSTDNTETSTSGSASSPSKSLKTSSSLSPAKRSGSESPKHPKGRG